MITFLLAIIIYILFTKTFSELLGIYVTIDLKRTLYNPSSTNPHVTEWITYSKQKQLMLTSIMTQYACNRRRQVQTDNNSTQKTSLTAEKHQKCSKSFLSVWKIHLRWQRTNTSSLQGNSSREGKTCLLRSIISDIHYFGNSSFFGKWTDCRINSNFAYSLRKWTSVRCI